MWYKSTMKYLKKVFKITLLLTTVFFFTSAPFSVEAQDCSHIKKLHKKLMCKAGSDVDAGDEKSKKGTKKVFSLKKWNEENKSLADIFKNITKN